MLVRNLNPGKRYRKLHIICICLHVSVNSTPLAKKFIFKGWAKGHVYFPQSTKETEVNLIYN